MKCELLALPLVEPFGDHHHQVCHLAMANFMETVKGTKLAPKHVGIKRWSDKNIHQVFHRIVKSGLLRFKRLERAINKRPDFLMERLRQAYCWMTSGRLPFLASF